MKSTNWRRLAYHVKHNYLTGSNLLMGVAFVVAASWVWGSITVMQRNFTLQKEVEDKMRQAKLTELEVQTLAYEQRYYKSTEYQELEARRRFGLANPGEKVMVLPPNSPAAKQLDARTTPQPKLDTRSTGEQNFEAWMNFLLGGNARSVGE